MDKSETNDTDAEIVPLDMSGIVDVHGNDITQRELMSAALANTAGQEYGEEFAVRRGSNFINEYPRVDESTGKRSDGGTTDTNHLLGCFPTLFPYGRGGFEVERPISISYESQARWALQYADKRFRKDPQFAFQVFGVCQKREVCRSAVLQTKKHTFAKLHTHIKLITPEELLKASKEEETGQAISNSLVKLLLQQTKAIRSKVTGTDESRVSIRSNIWSTNIKYGPPSIWITINPPDTHDPIAQIFCGEDIDLETFIRTAGPTASKRASNIASDPYAAARYFHFIIRTVLETLLGVLKKGENKIERKMGIFGIINCYIAVVEAQARGTLHLHMLLWLQGAPSSKIMREALQTDEFREKIRTYIQSVIHADIQELNDKEVEALPKEKEISYSRPFLPSEPNAQDRIDVLARTLQYHTCSTTTCLRLVRNKWICKRRFPLQEAREAWVLENGDWGPKRFCSRLNNWNSNLLACLRSNGDVKLLLNGAGTLALGFYITNYSAKKQNRTSNVSALLAKTLAFHNNNTKNFEDLLQSNKLLLQRCANTLNRYCEFSILEVISYLMGWNDRYMSHFYVNIYWDAARMALMTAYPDLGKKIDLEEEVNKN